MVFEASRVIRDRGSGIAGSTADSDAVDTSDFDDYETVHVGWEVPMGYVLDGQTILFQLVHQAQA